MMGVNSPLSVGSPEHDSCKLLTKFCCEYGRRNAVKATDQWGGGMIAT